MVRIGMHDQGPQKTPSSNTSLTQGRQPRATDPCRLLWIQDAIPYFQYPKLSLNRQLVHGVFTRQGGVSDAPYNSLNTSYDVGDRKKNVTENLQKIKKTIGAKHLIFMHQNHGIGIQVLRKDRPKPDGALSADAMITDIPRLALLVKQADCQGVIVFDAHKKVVANAHCGWRGSVQNILGRVVTRMEQDFGCRRSHLCATIGPSLGPCCAEFVSYAEIFPDEFLKFMTRKNCFDFWAISCRQLVEAGLQEDNIEVAGICTRCRPDIFFSYRAEGRTGRFGTVAMLR
jgi:YfiH family protein